MVPLPQAKRPAYYLVGATGFPNYGDELIAAGWLRYLARECPDADVWVDCHTPGNAQLLLGHLHPRVRFVDTLWRVCWEAPSEEPWEVAAFAAHAVDSPGATPRYVAGLELLRNVDVVHLIGGGYINAIWPRHLGLLAAAGAVARRFGARAAMTGAGLIPLVPGSAALLRRLAADFEIFDVRDTASWEELDGVTARSQSGDDVFLNLASELLDTRPSPEAIVCVQSDLVEGDMSWLAEMTLGVLQEWDVRGEAVGYVECIPGSDRKLFDMVEPYLPGIRFYPFAEIWRHGLPARPGQRWLSTRFHPHLVAATAGAWGLAVPVNGDYYDTKHRSLVDLGSGWVITSEPTDASAAHQPGWPRDRIGKLSAAKADIARAIYSNGSTSTPRHNLVAARKWRVRALI